MEQEKVIVEEEKVVTNPQLVLSLTLPTPRWATWVFRAVFLLTTALTIWIAGTSLISESAKVELMVAFKALDVLIWGAGRFIGIKKRDFDY